MKGRRLTKNSPLGPQGAYEQSKLKAEEACRAFFKKGSIGYFKISQCDWLGAGP